MPIDNGPTTAANVAMSVAASALRAQQSRMRVIAENLANADSTAKTPNGDPYRRQTPVFQPTKVDGGGQLALALPSGSGGAVGAGGQGGMVLPVRTDPAHLGFSTEGAAAGGWKSLTVGDSETKIDGNKVVIEDQMAKLTESRMDYQAVIGFYEKSMDMLKMAATAPGK